MNPKRAFDTPVGSHERCRAGRFKHRPVQASSEDKGNGMRDPVDGQRASSFGPNGLAVGWDIGKNDGVR